MNESKISAQSYRNLPRRRFTQEFKRQVVEQLLNSGLTVAEVAREHELHPNQLCRWRNEYRHETGPLPVPAQMLSLLPVTFAPDAEARQTPPVAAGDMGLRIALPRGEIYVLNGCVPELLRLVIEALQ